MITKQLSFFSPAKVNLFFRVLNRREDGYHHIQSLIQMLDFGDTLFFSLNTSCDLFTTTASYLHWNKDNLIYKAVALFRQQTGVLHPVKIDLKKSIPSQAGLGGGSSNAATTLYALNKLFDTQLSDQDLASMGALIGADVPCFFGLGRVYVEGVGEKLSPIKPVKQEYTIVQPYPLGLSTPLVYQHVNLQNCSKIPSDKLLKSFEKLNPVYINDLEHASFALAPELFAFKNQLLQNGLKHVIMTGSGSAFLIEGTQSSLNHLHFCQHASSIIRLPGHWY